MKKACITFLIGAFFLFPKCVLAAAEPVNKLPNTLIFDRPMSPYASSPCLMSMREVLSRMEDQVWPPSSEGWLERLLSDVSNGIVNAHLMTINHEVYGHGFRVRSLPMYDVVQYQFIYLPSFFSYFLLAFSVEGPAAITFSSLNQNLQAKNRDASRSSAENGEILMQVYKSFKDPYLLMLIGGSEANNVLTRELIFKHFSQGYLDHRDYKLLSRAFRDLPQYIVSNYISKGKGSVSDIALYIQGINAKHKTEGKNVLRCEDLESAAWVFLLNPILLHSIYSPYGYLFWGQTHSSIPHFSIGEANYMPLIRMGLTPFGLIYYLDNYVSYQNRTFLAGFQLGSSPFYTHSYGGLQLKTDHFWSYQNFYHLGLEAHVWRQPKLLMQPDDQVEDKNYWGGLLSLAHQFRINKDFSLNVTTLYKTPGFVEGIEARGGLLWRAGLTLHY